MESIAVIIPAYNESATISKVVRGLRKLLSRYKFQIIVVDDGSTDDTGQLAHQAGAHVITHLLNTGTGGATATGLNYAQQQGFQLAATLDADGQHRPQDVLRGIELIRHQKVDLLIGSRMVDTKGMSKLKVVGNRGLSVFTHILFGIWVTDSQSGLRVFSNKAIERLRWKTSGYEFCSEMLWRARQQKLKIKEYPIKAVYTAYSKSKGQNNWNAFNIVKSLLKRRVLELFGE